MFASSLPSYYRISHAALSAIISLPPASAATPQHSSRRSAAVCRRRADAMLFPFCSFAVDCLHRVIVITDCRSSRMLAHSLITAMLFFFFCCSKRVFTDSGIVTPRRYQDLIPRHHVLRYRLVFFFPTVCSMAASRCSPSPRPTSLFFRCLCTSFFRSFVTPAS